MINGNKIVVNMLVDARKEPYLLFCLKSIADAVDEIVVVANPDNKNAEVLNTFPKVRVAYLPFVDFATARNSCLDLSRDADYILRVDADEVHFTAQLAEVIRQTASQGKDGAIAAFYHFVKDFKHYQSIDGRLILFRNKPGMRWARKVDEDLEGFLPADVLQTPYRYHHYGYTKDQRVVWEGWMQRERILGTKEWYHDKDPDTILNERKLTEYKGAYPSAIDDFLKGKVR